MSIDWSNVEAIAPELASVATGSQAAILAIVNRQVSDTQWGTFADDGRTFLAAHYGTLNLGENGGGSAMVTSETLGPMSRTYAVTSSSSGGDGGLSNTGWGREYLRLLKIAVPRFLVTP